jgi:opacity protein-like surface antigen
MTKITTNRSAEATRFLLLSCVAFALLFWQAAAVSAAPAEATVELSGGKVAAGIGYRWGSGTLIFHGKRYPLNISGIGLGSVGVNEYTASGYVTGLQRPEDINGIYTTVGTGLTLGGGASIAEMKNDKGVTIQLDSTTEGLSVSVAATGVQISMTE